MSRASASSCGSTSTCRSRTARSPTTRASGRPSRRSRRSSTPGRGSSSPATSVVRREGPGRSPAPTGRPAPLGADPPERAGQRRCAGARYGGRGQAVAARRAAAPREPPLRCRGGEERPGLRRGAGLATPTSTSTTRSGPPTGPTPRRSGHRVPARLRRAADGARARDALEAHRGAGAAVRGHPRRREGVGQDRRHRQPPEQGRHAGPRWRHGQHVPAGAGQGGRQEPGRARSRRGRAPDHGRGRGEGRADRPAGRRHRREGSHPRHRVQDAARREDPGQLAHRRPRAGQPGHDGRGAGRGEDRLLERPAGRVRDPVVRPRDQGRRPDAGRARRGGRDGRRRWRRLGGGHHPAGPRRQDDPHLDRRWRLARVPRGPRIAGRDRPARQAGARAEEEVGPEEDTGDCGGREGGQGSPNEGSRQGCPGHEARRCEGRPGREGPGGEGPGEGPGGEVSPARCEGRPGGEVSPGEVSPGEGGPGEGGPDARPRRRSRRRPRPRPGPPRSRPSRSRRRPREHRHRCRRRPRDPRFARQPHRRGRCHPRGRLGRPGRGAVRGVDRRP